jgi:hypothetical protein
MRVKTPTNATTINSGNHQAAATTTPTINQPINNSKVAAPTIIHELNEFTAISCCRSKTGGGGTTKNLS